MGLSLGYNLFCGVEAAQVYMSYVQACASLGHRVEVVSASSPQGFDELQLYEPNNGWTILSLDGGWDLKERRQAALSVSEALQCPGFLIFVVDGDYWGYELFDNGHALDQFVQEQEQATAWFPGRDSCGHPEVIAALFPWVRLEDAAAYLVHKPDVMEAFADYLRLDVPARARDQHSRFSELAVLDFLRLLGIAIAVSNRYVTPDTPIWRAFRVPDWRVTL